MTAIKIEISAKEIAEYNKNYFKRHPRAKKCPIEKPQHPSLNWYITANNLQVNNTKQHWKQLMIMILENLGLCDMKITHCEIKYITYFPTARAHDLDNITPKFILDGLVEGGLLVDDNNRCIQSLTTQAKYDKTNPRIELWIIVNETKE